MKKKELRAEIARLDAVVGQYRAALGAAQARDAEQARELNKAWTHHALACTTIDRQRDERAHADRLIATLCQERDAARDETARALQEHAWTALERNVARLDAQTAQECVDVIETRAARELERALCDAGNLRAELQTAWKEMDALRARAEVLETMHGLGAN